MQYINHWPEDMAELTLPEAVSHDLHRQLTLPFESEQEAKDFWGEAPSSIIILESTDTIDALRISDTWNSIEFALTYPEYDIPLSNGYQMLVAVTTDSGGGIYLVVPPELSHITKSHEEISHE